MTQMVKGVYLDYAAATPLLPAVAQAMYRAMSEQGSSAHSGAESPDRGIFYGNAAALHSAGHTAQVAIEHSREQVAQLINADPTEIIFTSGGTESNNTVMHIFQDQTVAISAVEHPSVREAAKAWCGKVLEIGVDRYGKIDLEELGRVVRDKRPSLVSVMLANNEVGTVEPIVEVVKCCKNYNIPVHCDATQALGKIKIDVRALGIDYLTVSAHKIGGPIGVGALYVKDGARYRSLLAGGHQEGKRRAGTSNTVGIMGFGVAAQWCWDNWSCKKWQEVAKLRNALGERIQSMVPGSSYNGCERCVYKGGGGETLGMPNTLPNILNMSFLAAEGESTQLYLDAEGIIVSTGSACAAGDIRPSHVLMAMTGDAEVAHSSVRFSLGLDTTEADLERVMEVLPGMIHRLQGMSTVGVSKGNKSCSANAFFAGDPDATPIQTSERNESFAFISEDVQNREGTVGANGGRARDTRNESRRSPSEEDASIFFRGDDRESERSEDGLARRAPEEKIFAEQAEEEHDRAN